MKLIPWCQETDPEFIILLVRVAVKRGYVLRIAFGKEKSERKGWSGESVGNVLTVMSVKTESHWF